MEHNSNYFVSVVQYNTKYHKAAFTSGQVTEECSGSSMEQHEQQQPLSAGQGSAEISDIAPKKGWATILKGAAGTATSVEPGAPSAAKANVDKELGSIASAKATLSAAALGESAVVGCGKAPYTSQQITEKQDIKDPSDHGGSETGTASGAAGTSSGRDGIGGGGGAIDVAGEGGSDGPNGDSKETPKQSKPAWKKVRLDFGHVGWTS